MTTILVVTALMGAILLALKSLRKNKGCVGGCEKCNHSSACPAKNIQMLVEESRKSKSTK